VALYLPGTTSRRQLVDGPGTDLLAVLRRNLDTAGLELLLTAWSSRYHLQSCGASEDLPQRLSSWASKTRVPGPVKGPTDRGVDSPPAKMARSSSKVPERRSTAVLSHELPGIASDGNGSIKHAL